MAQPSGPGPSNPSPAPGPGRQLVKWFVHASRGRWDLIERACETIESTGGQPFTACGLIDAVGRHGRGWAELRRVIETMTDFGLVKVISPPLHRPYVYVITAQVTPRRDPLPLHLRQADKRYPGCHCAEAVAATVAHRALAGRGMTS